MKIGVIILKLKNTCEKLFVDLDCGKMIFLVSKSVANSFFSKENVLEKL